MRIIAIDPGPEQSAYVIYDTDIEMPCRWEKVPNEDLRRILDWQLPNVLHCAIEMVASYGMAVGMDVFQTCVEIGRFQQAWVNRTERDAIHVYRREVKLHLCSSVRATDANIRQALIDRYGPGKEKAIGVKAKPGPLYGLTGDCWSALAIAITAVETGAVTNAL